MPIMNQSVSVSAADESTLRINVGPEGFPLPLFDIAAVYNGSRTVEMLVFQLADKLQAAGVNPNTANAEDVAAALNGELVRWGN